MDLPDSQGISLRHLSLAAALLALAGQASAADLPARKDAPLAPAPATNDWRFEATLNGWAPSLLVNTGVGRMPTASSSIGFFTLLKNLYMNVPVSFVARNDDFIAGLDLYWVRLGTNAHFHVAPGSPFGGVNAGLTIGQTILTGFGGVRVPLGSPDLSLYAIAGARYVNVNESVNLSVPVAGFDRFASLTKNWVNPIVGATLRYKIDAKWFIDGEADIGGTGGSATWQAFGAVGYNWTESLSSTLGFRALYIYDKQYNSAGGSFRMQETLYGPQMTLSYRF
jgi:hypothetical protein